MADTEDTQKAGGVAFDATVAHPARIYDYWLGGKDNFAADRIAAEEVLTLMPSMAQVARQVRMFLAAVVHHLAADAGIRQFLDIGTGLPTVNNTHDVAQRAAPGARVVYVDNDPIVLLHAGALLTCSPPGRCAYIEADMRDPDRVLAGAAATLDLTEPVAVMMLGLLHFLTDADAPYALTRYYLDALVPGSYLAVSHASSDIESEPLEAAAKRYNAHSATPIILRSKAEITPFFDGLDLIPPGITPLGQWAPGAALPGSPGLPTYTALARKPARRPNRPDVMKLDFL
ncbi:MAG: SAM-dependent methyltransferase [Streptosporangiaceae bacterium]